MTPVAQEAWVKLDTKAVSIGVGIPTNFQLVYAHDYEAKSTYKGAQQVAVVYCLTQSFEWTTNVEQTLVQKFEEETASKGEQMLRTEVYSQTIPSMWPFNVTEFYVQFWITNTHPSQYGGAVAYSELVILGIIAAVIIALLIVGLIVLRWTLVSLKDVPGGGVIGAGLGIALAAVGVAAAVVAVAYAYGKLKKK